MWMNSCMVEGHLLHLFQAPNPCNDGFGKAIFSHQLEFLHIHFLDTLKSFGLPWWHSG